MQLQNNTILITGGGSGIGLALAREFRQRGNQVIVSNRSDERLETAKAAGFPAYKVDMANPGSIQEMTKSVLADYPDLNGVIQNAGIMEPENIKNNLSGDVQQRTIDINLSGPMHLNRMLLPHLIQQKSAFIMTVSSGLAFIPAALFPTYCATKAGIHSYTQSLRYQLKGTPVQVIELAPPYVQTSLTGPHQQTDPDAMGLNEFTAEVMDILRNDPDVSEILVDRVLVLRNAESKGLNEYYAFFNEFNDQMMAKMGGSS